MDTRMTDGESIPPPSGATRLVGIVGDPVRQVKSPTTFNRAFARRGVDAIMVPLHVGSATFETDIEAIMRLGNLDGLVVTMPYKARIMSMLTSIEEDARLVGAVNAARRTASGDWIGNVFDGVGLIGAARGIGLDPSGLRIALVGAGGAGNAIAFALAKAGADRIVVADRDGEKAGDLVRRLGDIGQRAEPVVEIDPHGFDLVVNASPAGMMTDDAPPFDVSGLKARTAVIDIVTRAETRLLQAAKQIGCRTAGGAAMVAAQTEAIIDFLAIRSEAA